MNKVFKLSWAGVLSLSLIAVLFSCQKNVSDPLLTSAAKAGGGGGGSTTPPPAYVFSLPTYGTACVTDGSYCFDASFTNKGGNAPGGNNSITVSISKGGVKTADDQVVEGTFGNFCFTGLVAGEYNVQVYFSHNGSENAQPVNVPLSFTLTVQAAEDCGSECTADGVSLTRSSSVIETDVIGRAVNVTSVYTVANCGAEDLTGLKLQGGLVNKASGISASPKTGDLTNATNLKYKLSSSNGNNVLTWTFDLAAGKSQDFTVTYSVWGTSCGSPLSGAWSLKNSAGIPIGVAEVDELTGTGYLDRLYWDCSQQ